MGFGEKFSGQVRNQSRGVLKETDGATRNYEKHPMSASNRKTSFVKRGNTNSDMKMKLRGR